MPRDPGGVACSNENGSRARLYRMPSGWMGTASGRSFRLWHLRRQSKIREIAKPAATVSSMTCFASLVVIGALLFHPCDCVRDRESSPQPLGTVTVTVTAICSRATRGRGRPRPVSPGLASRRGPGTLLVGRLHRLRSSTLQVHFVGRLHRLRSSTPRAHDCGRLRRARSNTPGVHV